APFATGLATGERGYVGMLEHVCSADADCADANACNGVEQCVDNECIAPAGPLSCDDADACTTDDCDDASGCTHAPVPDCCDEDLDCAVDELCDLEVLRCVPFGAITTGAEQTGGEGSGGGASEGSTGESLTEGTAAGATDDGGQGCACSSTGNPAPLVPRGAVPWLVLLLVRPRRRHATPLETS
ncbi:MAG: hypothetical protein AB1Z98_21630, partial [Nannocystaceae bacterium]